jgi:hypothetical protein
MRIGKSQRAYKNLTPEARKNHLGKKKIHLLGTPFLIFRPKKSLKKKNLLASLAPTHSN